jgi:hypothetical protein
MKRITTIFSKGAALVLLITLLQGCLKDTCNQTYTIHRPVYKTFAEVRANIKSNVPVAVKKPGKMFLYGNYIFLNEVDKGIHIIDNSNPSSPVNKYFIDLPGNIDLAVRGNTLYADFYNDMVTLDISDPANVQVKKVIENAFPFRRYTNGFVADTSLIIVDWIIKDTTVSVQCENGFWSQGGPRSYLALSSADKASSASAPMGISGSMARFSMFNNYLYTVTETALNVFNITQPTDPVFSNKVNVGLEIETIYPFKGNLFIGSRNGMFIYGTSNPAQPNRLSSFSHVRSCDPVIADDKYAYVTLRSGTACVGFTNQLDVLDVQNLNTPLLVKTYQLTNPHGLSKDGNTLFICDGSAGLKIYDASNVNTLKLLHTVGGIDTYDVIAHNGVAIVVTKDGLYQYDYSNLGNVKLLSKISYQ